MSGRRSWAPRPRRPRARSTARSRASRSTTTIRSSPRRPGTTSSSPTASGAPVRVRDIGRAVDAPENTKLAAWTNGTRCILLAVFKQPGANVIDTVNQVRAALPRLEATIPAAIDVAVLSDRTQTIRASVAGVESTLAITIVLVVAVIFLFLRSVWATIIPAITVPLSLAGTFAVMYLLGYSLDNLSLMGLTIAVGFVVDDAIVMLENIVRHIEDGLSAARGGAQGSRRDRLHHRLDQPLAGRRVHPAAADERHRRPAVPGVRRHRDGGDPGLGVDRADPDADDVLALPQKQQGGKPRPRLSVLRADVRPAAGGLRMGLEARAGVSPADALRVPRHADAHRGPLCFHPERASSRSRTREPSPAAPRGRRTSPRRRCGAISARWPT